MKNPRLILLGFFLIFLVSYFLYFSPDWIRAKTDWLQFDKPIHAFGGYMIAASGFFLFGLNRWWSLGLLVLFVGIGWEIVEVYVNPWLLMLYDEPITFGTRDTYGDILADVVGGLGFWFLHCRRKENN